MTSRSKLSACWRARGDVSKYSRRSERAALQRPPLARRVATRGDALLATSGRIRRDVVRRPLRPGSPKVICITIRSRRRRRSRLRAHRCLARPPERLATENGKWRLCFWRRPAKSQRRISGRLLAEQIGRAYTRVPPWSEQELQEMGYGMQKQIRRASMLRSIYI
jgi:hypothetical protein